MKLFRKSESQLTQAEITEWLRELRGSPYNPSSDFDVTAIFRVKFNEVDTYYFAGVNVENIDHRLSTHGEEGAIAAMATALGKTAEIVEGWVMGAPKHLKQGDTHFLANSKVTCCGKCRQQIAGFAAPSAVMHSISLNGEHQQTTVGEFLPEAFNFRQFIPELLEPPRQLGEPLSEFEIENKLIRQGRELSEVEIIKWLLQLESVDYATKTGQAVILKLSDNKYVAGVNIEEAAYVDINPIQSAIAIANAAFGKGVLVEEVWTYKKEAKQDQFVLQQFANFKQADYFRSLPLSAIQVLAEFAKNEDITIHMNGCDGFTRKDIKLKESAHYAPIFQRQAENTESKRALKAVMQ